jgi:hypothetical protein
MSREVLIPIAFAAVVVLRLTMMLVYVPQRRRGGSRSGGAAPHAPAAEREAKEKICSVRVVESSR